MRMDDVANHLCDRSSLDWKSRNGSVRDRTSLRLRTATVATLTIDKHGATRTASTA